MVEDTVSIFFYYLTSNKGPSTGRQEGRKEILYLKG
jgi:hypothetical protein